MEDIATLLDRMIADPRHGWSIGTFGAIGEFVREPGEVVEVALDGPVRRIRTARGGMAVAPDPALRVVAYDTLSSDGETWGQSVAFCLPAPARLEQDHVRALGPDTQALAEADRQAELFDLGVGLGHVRFCLRTDDLLLIDALHAMEGESLFSEAGRTAMAEVMRAQPHRVLLSPIGRVEVYQPIPQAGGESPEGPHTHLLPKLLKAARTHAANAPIPDGLQPVLMLHPRSPWRDGMGRRVPFDEGLDDLFQDLIARHGLPSDLAVRAAVEDAVDDGLAPDAFAWPETRRGRIEARIALRRMARGVGGERVAPWRQRYDRTADAEPDEEAAQHA